MIVFGSYSKNTTHRDSDIDVAFYSQDSSHFHTRYFYWPRNWPISLK
ncbi:nucleotidyltransferase domain-containing protein [Peribacillus sp. Bi96]|nr:nucleotidyltransferase domain-containing protein [Peribacillus sp. Bi96]